MGKVLDAYAKRHGIDRSVLSGVGWNAHDTPYKLDMTDQDVIEIVIGGRRPGHQGTGSGDTGRRAFRGALSTGSAPAKSRAAGSLPDRLAALEISVLGEATTTGGLVPRVVALEEALFGGKQSGGALAARLDQLESALA